MLGAAFGLAGAFFLRQTLQAQLYETGAMDPRVVAAVAGMLIVVALIACVLPARRAAKTDPLIASKRVSENVLQTISRGVTSRRRSSPRRSDLDRHELADALFGQQAMQIVDAAHRLAAELDDQIAGTQTGFGRRRALGDRGDRHAALVREVMQRERDGARNRRCPVRRRQGDCAARGRRAATHETT